MNKIVIIGCGGSGKSTFSRSLHEITGIPLVHLDRLYWKPNWVETDKAEWGKIVASAIDEERWIMDGNFGGTMHIRFEKADTIIFLDRSRWLCLYRVIKRTIANYGKTRPDMTEGCNERFDWTFLKYIYGYNDTRRPKILLHLEALKSTKNVIILSNDQAVKDYLIQVHASTLRR